MDDLIICSLQKVEYIAQTGCIPWVAIPAASNTACSSAIPTSINRSRDCSLEGIQSGSARHGSGDAENLLVFQCELRQI